MAKSIRKKTEKETLKERRRSGEFKQDKKDARAAGLSRGEARKRAKRLSNVEAFGKRKGMRADMAAKREEDASVRKMFGDRRRMEAKRGGQKLAYDVAKPLSPAEQREMAPGGTPTRKIKSGDKVSKEKGMYKIVGADGYVRYSESKPEIIKTRKNKAMYGAKVKAVKKAKNGGKVTDPPRKRKTFKTLAEKNLYDRVGIKQGEMSGAFGPKDAESAKLIAKSDNIKSNKVTVKGEEEAHKVYENDYKRKQAVKKFIEQQEKSRAVKKAQEGGKVKSKSFGVLKSDANKTGPKMEEGKEPYTKNGITYTWDRKNSVWRGDLDKKKSRAVKKK